MGSIKDRNVRDLTEAEDIRRGGKNTQKNLFLVWFCNSVGRFISLTCKVGIISHSVEIYSTSSVKCFANLR